MKRQRSPSLVPTGTARQTIAAAPAYPKELLDLVHENDLDEGSAYLAWQLAQFAPEVSPGERETFMVLVGRLLAAQALGSTRLATTERDRTLLAKLPDLAHDAPARTPLVLDGNFLYAQHIHACENRVALRLLQSFGQRTPFAASAIAGALDEVAAQSDPSPSDEQKAAVATALGRQLGIISGGPGTGKTTTALALVRALVRLGIPPEGIALCAPTGKAAGRLADDFRTRLGALKDPAAADRALLADLPKPQTLHRLLGLSRTRGGVPRAARDPLPFQAVIVDESSMIDLGLMDRLLVALLDDVFLVLLGDADQLPSIAAGAVFRDLGPMSVRLSRGFRADVSQPEGKQLTLLATAVRAGHVESATGLCLSRSSPEQIVWQGVELLVPEQRDELLRTYHRRMFGDVGVAGLADHVYQESDRRFAEEDTRRLDALALHLARMRILAVTRQGATGVDDCNSFLHTLSGGGPGLLPGEPVLMLRNDYERELWNGDQGIAVRVRQSGQPPAVAVAFRSREGWRTVDARAMASALGLGFALSVHKAQGSEFDEVLLVLPDFDCPLLTRELLYTAISRARKSVVLCGTLARFSAGIATGETRNSGLTERMAAATATS